MEARNIRVRTLSILSSVLLLVVLVLVNVAAARMTNRIDLTEDQLFTLNDGSRAVLESLEDPATIKVFWHNIPSSFGPTRRYVEGLLEEMQGAAGDRLQVQWVDMEEDAGIKEAQTMGVPEEPFGVVTGDEVRQTLGYMSMAVELGDEKPLVLQTLHTIRHELEYKIIAELHRRTRLATPVVALVIGRAEGDPGRAGPHFGRLDSILRTGFAESYRSPYKRQGEQTTPLDMSDPVPPDIDVLILAAPQNLSAVKAYNLEQFVLRGGRLLLMLDPVDFHVLFRRGATSQPTRSGLESWLEHLGVATDTGAVADFQNMGLFIVGRELLRYPAWPVATAQHADRSNPIARSLQPMMMRWPAGFTVDEKKQTDAGRTTTLLATTSEKGYRRPDLLGLTDSADHPQGKLLETIPLVLLLQGPMTSFWKDKDLPQSALPPGPGGFPGESLPPAGTDDAEASGSPDGDATGDPDGATPDDGSEAPPPEKGAPEKGAPKQDEPKQDDPKKDEPKKDAPKQDEPATDGAGGPAEDEEDADDGDDGDAAPAPAPADEPAPGADDAGDPAPADEPAPGPAPDDGAKAAARANHLDTGSGRIILCGDAGMVVDTWVAHQRAPGFVHQLNFHNGRVGQTGFGFVSNATDWLSGSEELLMLRSRNDTPRTLEPIERDQQKFVQWVNVLLIPLLVLIAGLVVFVVRRR